VLSIQAQGSGSQNYPERFPFDQKFRFEISGIPYDEWNGIFRFVEPTRPKPSRSEFRAKIQTVKQGKMC